MIVCNVRVGMLGVAAFAGVRRVASTKDTVRRPTANGPFRFGCAVVELAGRVTAAPGADFRAELPPVLEQAVTNATAPIRPSRREGFTMTTTMSRRTGGSLVDR
jgi:hypothetical protein